MTSKTKRAVWLAAGTILISGCAAGPVPPSLPAGQFVVIVKGEAGPLNTFNESVQHQMANRMLPGCEAKIPARVEGTTTSGGAAEQLVYECAPASQARGGDLLEIFARAYRNNAGGLLEMKITTSAGCIAKSCFGGPLRYWQQNAVCFVLC